MDEIEYEIIKNWMNKSKVIELIIILKIVEENDRDCHKWMYNYEYQ